MSGKSAFFINVQGIPFCDFSVLLVGNRKGALAGEAIAG